MRLLYNQIGQLFVKIFYVAFLHFFIYNLSLSLFLSITRFWISQRWACLRHSEEETRNKQGRENFKNERNITGRIYSVILDRTIILLCFNRFSIHIQMHVNTVGDISSDPKYCTSNFENRHYESQPWQQIVHKSKQRILSLFLSFSFPYFFLLARREKDDFLCCKD